MTRAGTITAYYRLAGVPTEHPRCPSARNGAVGSVVERAVVTLARYLGVLPDVDLRPLFDEMATHRIQKGRG